MLPVTLSEEVGCHLLPLDVRHPEEPPPPLLVDDFGPRHCQMLGSVDV